MYLRYKNNSIRLVIRFIEHNCIDRPGAFLNWFKYILRRCRCCINNERMYGMYLSVVAWNNVNSLRWIQFIKMISTATREEWVFIDDVWRDVFIWSIPRVSWQVRVLSIINHLYVYGFRSTIEATDNLNSNLVIFLRVGAFEQLFGPGRGASEQTKFSKNSNVRGGLPRGMLKLWLVH